MLALALALEPVRLPAVAVWSPAVVSSGGATRAPGGDLEHCLWRGAIVDSTVNPLLAWPGEDTEW